MTAVDSVEQDLVAHFRARADQAPGGEGWNGVLDRVEARGRRRNRRRTAAAALAVVALTGTVLSVVDRGDSGGRAVETGPAADTDAQLPHLLLDLPGYELDHASELNAPASLAPELRRSGPLRHSVLTEADRGYDGRVLFVTTAAPGAGYGVGERNSGARAVRVAGHDAWLIQYSSLPVRSLGWYTPDGAAMHLVGVRMDDEALLAAGRDLRLLDGGTLAWEPGPPAGLVEQQTVVVPLDARSTAEVRYVRGESQLTLRIQDGGQAVLTDLVRDRVSASGELRRASIDGAPAVLARYASEDRTSLMWEVRPGVVAELVARRAPDVDISEIARSIAEVGDAEWRAVLEPFAPPANDPRTVADIALKVCQVRDQWLEAAGETRTGVARTFASLRPHALGRGLDERSEILAVIDRLTTAMVAGNEVAVRATPSGTC